MPTPTPLPTAVPAPVTVPAPTAVPSSETPVAPERVCAGKTIYIQIHGPEQRELARSYRERWRALGASVPPIEDVVATALKRGRSVPQPVSATSVRFHDAGSRACAEQLEAVINPAAADVDRHSWKVTPLAPSLRATPGVIEVWLAP